MFQPLFRRLRGAVLIGGVIGCGPWISTIGAQLWRPILQPKQYRAPSGSYLLSVDPSSRSGAGPARCRLERDGVIVWDRELPLSFWDARVSDTGRVGGYAYDDGYSGYGNFHIVILDEAGGFVLNEASERDLVVSHHGPVVPVGGSIVFHSDIDRMILEIDEAPDPIPWRVYGISDGARHPDWSPPVPIEVGERQQLHLRDAHAIPGTELTLLHWWLRDWAMRPGGIVQEGAVFSLVDAQGQTVWVLERSGEYMVDEESRAAQAASRAVWKKGAVLAIRPSSFELWFPSENARCRFGVSQGEAGENRVYPASYQEDYDPLARGDQRWSPVELQRLATVHLASKVQPPSSPSVEGVAPEPGCMTLPTSAWIDYRGWILLEDDQTCAWHVFDRAGVELYVCPPPDGEEGPRSAHSLWTAFVGRNAGIQERYAPDGTPIGVGASGASGRWVSSEFGEEVIRLGPQGEELSVLTRDPAGRWWRKLEDFHLSADGRVLVVLDSPQGGGDEPDYLSLFDGEGLSGERIPLPRLRFSQVAASRRWIAIAFFAPEVLLYDQETKEMLYFTPVGEGQAWHWSFSPEGDELWAVELQAALLHRFALPVQ